jgi:hypothetical protein
MLSLVICSGCVPGETPKSAYPDLAAAVAAGAVDSGWIPPWLPSGATALREIHDIDNNQSALSFQPGATVNWRPPSSCTAVDAATVLTPTLRVPGWPSTQRLRISFSVYQCEEPGSTTANFFAMSSDGQQALYWRMHRR